MALESVLVLPSADQLKQQFLEDLQLQAIDAGVAEPPLGQGSEWDLLATGEANIGALLLENVQTLDEDSDPLRAQGDALDTIRRQYQLPEMLPSAGSGRLSVTVDGVATIPSGLGFVAPNGLRGTIPGGAVSVTGTVQVSAGMTDTGPAGNLVAGTKVRLVGGPPNIRTEATVPEDWTGGTLVEDDTRKRERILARIQGSPINWQALREAALNSTTAISDAFVYDALGGPDSAKVVVVSGTSTLTREVDASIVTNVQAGIDAAFPTGVWNVVAQSALDAPYDIGIAIALPLIGRHRWVAGGPSDPTIVASVVSETEFTVTDAATLGSLSVNETIACWNIADAKAATAKVLSIDTATGEITTTVWANGSGPGVNDWIFPACDGIDDIVAAWLGIMRTFSPGENVDSTDPRLQFCYRKPPATSDKPIDLTNAQLLKLLALVPEATNIQYVAVASTVPIPATVEDPPSVICLRRFGIYPL
jgi:hypothetical protein